LCWAGVARVLGYRKAFTGRVSCTYVKRERVEACTVSAGVSHAPWACGSRRLLQKCLHSATPSTMPVTIVHMRVADAVACEKCHLCARGEFGLGAASRWCRSQMSWVKSLRWSYNYFRGQVPMLVVQLFSTQQLPTAPWRQEDIAVHSGHYTIAQHFSVSLLSQSNF